jgi:hypothetical protein
MATFEIDNLRGSFDGKTWKIDDPVLQNEILPDMAKLYRPEGFQPNWANGTVQFVMDKLGGRVIELDGPQPAEDVPGRVYYKTVEDSDL